MFTEKQLNNYAEAMLWGLNKMNSNQKIKKGDVVLIRTMISALPLAEMVYTKLLQAEYHPIVDILMTEELEVIKYDNAKDFQLDFFYPWWKEKYEHVRGSIFLWAPTSITHLEHVDSEKQQRIAKTQKPWRKFMNDQEDKGLFSWTLCCYPTEVEAEKAGLSLEEFKNQVVKSCYLDSDSSVAEFDRADVKLEELKAWLVGMDIDSYHVESANIDLTIKYGKQRQWVGGRGANIPSFELFTSPDCRFTEGIYYADQPSYRGGKLVEGVRLEFKDGKVVKATAEKSEDYLNKILNTDEDACKVGEFSLTDTRLSKIDKFMANTLYDENYGGNFGNCHIAIGCSYTEAFAGDKSDLTDELKKELGFSDSVIHWDLVNTEDKTVTAIMKDGSEEVIYKNGRFMN